jgi:hypothetical protein
MDRDIAPLSVEHEVSIGLIGALGDKLRQECGD